MKILLVNNHTSYIKNLLENLDHVTKIDYELLENKSYDDYDAIILSGGHKKPLMYNIGDFSKEIELVKNTNVPILGICFGFEIINYAFNENITLMDNREHGELDIEIIKKDEIFEGLPNKFKVYESHRWVVQKENNLIPLAKSKDGIEAVKHPKKLIYGVQFHPEVFLEDSHADLILRNFIDIVKNKKI